MGVMEILLGVTSFILASRCLHYDPCLDRLTAMDYCKIQHLVDGIENVTNKKEKPKKTNPTNKQTLATPTRRLTIRWQNEKVLRFRDLLDDVIEVCRRCNGHLPWKVETYDTNWLKLKICPGGRFIPFSMNSSYLCIFYMQSTVHLDILICNSLSSIQMYAILNVNMLALISYTLIPRIT